jgi:SAM-dependent methyltransferase
MTDAEFRRIVNSASARYAPAGRFEDRLARGKIAADPVYRVLLDRGTAEAASVTDLGCGRGYLPALILEARARPEPPLLHGVELAARPAALARLACGDALELLTGDLTQAAIPPAAVITLLDVLHYLPRAAHERLLERCAAALAPGGRLFIRDADAGAGAGFLAVRLAERVATIGRGHALRRFAYRHADELARTLASYGLSVTVEAMGQGTPFANVLLEARAPA